MEQKASVAWYQIPVFAGRGDEVRLVGEAQQPVRHRPGIGIPAIAQVTLQPERFGDRDVVIDVSVGDQHRRADAVSRTVG